MSGLGAAYTRTVDETHVYYTGLDSGIYEFLGSGLNTPGKTLQWVTQPEQSTIWAPADYPAADIAAVG